MDSSDAVPVRVQQLLGCSLQEALASVSGAAAAAVDELRLQSGLLKLFTSSDWAKQALKPHPAADSSISGRTIRKAAGPSLIQMLVPALLHGGTAPPGSAELRKLATSLGLLTRPYHLPATGTELPGERTRAHVRIWHVCIHPGVECAHHVCHPWTCDISSVPRLWNIPPLSAISVCHLQTWRASHAEGDDAACRSSC